MRIETLWIEKFKNLRNFEITFENYLTTVFIGRNGTGKSNLIEAIAIIFRDLDLEMKNSDSLQFEYYIEYECRGYKIEIDANPNQTSSQSI
jgi:recombinational DNA repair ATPase RecF